MEERRFPVELDSRARSVPSIRQSYIGFTGADLDRARFIAELVARSASTAEETIEIADSALVLGIAAAARGDLTEATHVLSRALIAAALSAWQLNALAADAHLDRNVASAHAHRRAAEWQFATLPGRARAASAALRPVDEGDRAVAQLRAMLLAFVEGAGLARALLSDAAMQRWMQLLADAFASGLPSGSDGDTRMYGVPRLMLPETRIDSRRGKGMSDGRAMLSARERDVICQIVAGLTTSQIAAKLGVKNTTVSTLVGRIFNKLGVNNRPAAVAVALRYGVCAQPDGDHT